MRIQNVEVRKLALPMVHGFRISSGEIAHKEAIITKLYADGGLEGYGESSSFRSPIFTDETSDDVLHAIKDSIAPKVVGKYFETPEAFIAAYDDLTGSPAARHGVECAYWHLLSLCEQKSLSELFGGTRDRIPVGESIGLKDTITETLEEAELRLTEGYRRIKLKIRPGWDIKLVKAVRQTWPEIDLSVDANAAYDFGMHAAILRSLDAYQLSMIEQPFVASKLTDSAALQHIIETPICLDESIRSLTDLELAVTIGACKIVNIKPLRVGGIMESIKIHDYASARGIGVWCGGMLETGIGRAFNIALASKSGFIYPADMSPYQFFFSEDLVGPSYHVERDGYIDVPKAPGLGYTVRKDMIDKYTVYKAIV